MKRWIRSLFARPQRIQKSPLQLKKRLELLSFEDRIVPAFTIGLTSVSSQSIDEGTFFTFAGTWTDTNFTPGTTPVTISATPNMPYGLKVNIAGGEVIETYDGATGLFRFGSWSYKVNVLDGGIPSDVYKISTSVSNGTADPPLVTPELFNFTAVNVKPAITVPADQSFSTLSPSITLGSFDDPGDDALWTVEIDFDGDSTYETSFSQATTGAIPAKTFIYSFPGIFTASMKVTDKDGAVSSIETFEITIFGDTSYVNDDWSMLTKGTSITDADPTVPGDQPGKVGYNAFGSISEAVALTAANGTIKIQAGTYAESVPVAKTFTILGPNAGTPGNSMSRAPEAVITSPVANLTGSVVGLFSITANNVIVDGLTFDGDNTLIPGGTTVLGGADSNAKRGIAVGAADNVIVQNNIFLNLYGRGTQYEDVVGVPAVGGLVTNNLFQNIGDVPGNDGYALLVFDSTPSFTNNVSKNINYGSTYQFLYTDSTPVNVTNNDLSVEQIGFGINETGSSTGLITVANNIINVGTGGFGGFLWSVAHAAGIAITSNSITGSGGAGSRGLYAWTGTGAQHIPVTGGTISGFETGIHITNEETVGPFGNATALTKVSIDGVGITPATDGTAILVDDTAAGTETVRLNFTGTPSTINANGNSTGLHLTGALADVTNLGALTSFAGYAGKSRYIVLSNGALGGNILDATAASFNSVTGGSATVAQAHAIEDRLSHATDIGTTVGFVMVVPDTIFANALSTSGVTPTASVNDYNTLANSIDILGLSSLLRTIYHKGNFDFTEANADAAWASASYRVAVPGGINDLTLTADALGDAIFQGPGDLTGANLERLFSFAGGTLGSDDNQSLTISNLTILDFDLAVGMFNSGAGTNAFDGLIFTNNSIRIPADSILDVNQNIGLHYSFGKNQTISNNSIEIVGTGLSDTPNSLTSFSFAIQSNTSGGDVYNGLLITGNTITVTGAQTADPALIRGIWENGHAHSSNITISNNKFLNADPGNDPLLNKQSAYHITSHSGASSTVIYSNNTISGAKIGFEWRAASDFSGNQPIQVTGNQLTNVATGAIVQSQGQGKFSDNSLVNSGAMAGLGTGLSVAPLSSATIDDTVDENEISGFATGVLVKGSAVIAGNNASIHGNSIGVDVDGGNATITGNHIYNNGIGIRFANAGTGSVTNNDFDDTLDNFTDLLIAATAGSVTIGDDNNFAGDNFFIDNFTNQSHSLIPSTGTTFDQSDNFEIENRMGHRLDTDRAVTTGLHTWVSNSVFVTTPGGGSTDSNIQRGIDASSAGFTVNVQAGTYSLPSQLNVNKAVILQGAGKNLTYVGHVGSTTMTEARTVEVTAAATIRDLSLTGWDDAPLPANYGRGYLVWNTANGTTYDNVAFVANNIRVAIYIGTSNNVTIEDSAFTGSLYRYGIRGAGLNMNIVRNTFDTAHYEGGPIYMEYGAPTSGQISDNKFEHTAGVTLFTVADGNFKSDGTTLYTISNFQPNTITAAGLSITNNTFIFKNASTVQTVTGSYPRPVAVFQDTTVPISGPLSISNNIFSGYDYAGPPLSATNPLWHPTGGVFGGALEFDGIDDFGLFKSSAFDVGTSGTLSFWIKMNDVSRRNQFFEGPGNGGLEMQYRTNTGGQFYGRTTTVGGDFVIRSGGDSSALGTWTNLQYIWDFSGLSVANGGGKMRIFRDGVESTYLAGSTPTDLVWGAVVSTINQVMNVGRDPGDSSRYFDGLMDDVVWFNDDLEMADRDQVRLSGAASMLTDPRMVALWNFDQSSGNVAVDLKNSIPMYIITEGTLPADFGPQFVPGLGQFGGALEFDGLDDYATFNFGNNELGDKGTLNFWVKMDDVTRRNQLVEGPGNGGFEAQFRTNSGGQFYGRVTTDGDFVIRSGGDGALASGTWTNLQYIWDFGGLPAVDGGGKMRIYVNGVESAYLATFTPTDLSWASIVSTINGVMNIGRDPGDVTRFFDGMMDDIAWFDDVLPAADRALIRTSSVSALSGDSRLVAYWNLDDAPGTTVVAGNGGTSITLYVGANPPTPPIPASQVISVAGGTVVPVIHDNWFDIAPGTTAIYSSGPVNADNNYWNTNVESDVAAAVFDTINVDFSSYLWTDNNTANLTTNPYGFTGDYSALGVTSLANQLGTSSRIQDAADDLLLGGADLHVNSGVYPGNVNTTAAGLNVNFHIGASPGQVTIVGNLSLDTTDTINFELAGTTPGTGYDQLVVTGTTDLGGATANVTRSFDPITGTVFTIVDGTGALSGIFAGYPDGSIYTITGLPFTVNYTGNDVTLTLVAPATVWANDNWVITNDVGAPGLSAGDTVANTGSGDNGTITGKIFGFDAFATIQSAVDSVADGGTVFVLAGTYIEDVNLTSGGDGLDLIGEGANLVTLSGAIGGNGATIVSTANNVLVEGLTITREGNNPVDWMNPGLNFAGISLNAGSGSIEIRNNRFFGNRTAIDINNTGSIAISIHNNLIDNNRTGLIFRNSTNNVDFYENFVQDNHTIGILFLDASGGTNVPVQSAIGSKFYNNSFADNWYGQIVDRQTGGALPAPGANPKDFQGNWFGTNNPVVSTATSSEPGYSGTTIPVIFGGTETAPGGQPDILGPASANFDFSPYLWTGVDTNLSTFGFQGDFSSLGVTTEGSDHDGGTDNRVTEGIDYQSGVAATVNVLAGSYASDPVNLNRTVTVVLQGNATVGSLASTVGSGRVFDLNGNILTTGGDNTSTNYHGTLIGTGTSKLVKQGAGTMGLTADNSAFTGEVDVAAGTLDLTGKIGGDAVVSGTLTGNGFILGDLTVQIGGQVSADGLTVDDLVNHGSVSPANGATGSLYATSYTQSATGTLVLDVNGPVVDNDVINISTGNVVLNGSLAVSSTGTAISFFTTIPIINVVGSGTVSGNFVGLLNGFYITAGANSFQIFYTGGSGNDVTLFSVPAPVLQPLTFADDKWIGYPDGTDVSGDTGVPNSFIGYNAFSKIQPAIDHTTPTGTLLVFPGVYLADSINMGLNAQIISLVTGANVVVDGPLASANSGAKVLFNKGSLSIGDASNSAFNGLLTGLLNTTGFVKQGSGTLTITNPANNYVGATKVLGGTLALGADEVIPNSSTVTLTGSTLDLGGYWETIGALAGGSTVDLGSGGKFSVGNTNVSTTFNGKITGTGDIVKQGSGTFTISSSTSDFVGTTTVEAGTLQLGNGGATGAIPGPIQVDLGSTLAINRSTGTVAAPLAFGNTISGDGRVLQNGSGATRLIGTNSFTGGVTVSKGTIVAASDSELSIGDVTLLGIGKLAIDGNFSSTRTITADTTAAITIASGKTLTLNGGTLNGGTLNGPGVLATTGNASLHGTFVGPTGSITAIGTTSFDSISNGGGLTVDSGVSASFTAFANLSGGALTLNGTATADGFTSNGNAMITGTLTNVGSTKLIFGGGSITEVSATGLVDVGTTGAFASSALIRNAGAFGNATGVTTVDFGARFAAVTGSVDQNIVTQNGGVYAPGSSPGSSNSGGFNVNGGGIFEFEISNATGTAGALSGWDLVTVQPSVFTPTSATLNLTATPVNPYIVRLFTRLNSGDFNTPGNAANFNKSLPYAWKFIDASHPLTSIIGTFNPASFLIDTNGFTNATDGTFSIAALDGGKNLYVVYTPNTSVLSYIVNNGDTQRSRILSIQVNFNTAVDASTLTSPGAITLTRTAIPSNGVGTVGTVVDTSNGLLVSPASGMVTSITLTFADVSNAGIDHASLSDGRWQLAIPSANFTSITGDTNLRRLFGDYDNNGTVDAVDFGVFGSDFGLSLIDSASDFDNNGSIDGTDFVEYGARFGVTL